MTVWLVRHGATDWSDAGRFTGLADIPLNAAGREQAAGLRPVLEPLAPTAVWSSPSGRAVETARLALGEPRIDPRLSELDFGDLEGATWDECSPEQQAGLLAFDGFVAPNGGSVAELEARLHDFLAGLAPGHHVVFTHGGVIRTLLRARGEDRPVAPGEVVRLALSAD